MNQSTSFRVPDKNWMHKREEGIGTFQGNHTPDFIIAFKLILQASSI